MGSINFYVGQNLPLTDFGEYLEPELTNRGMTVTDKIELRYHPTYGAIGIFVAAHGEGDLEDILMQSISQVYRRSKAGEIDRRVKSLLAESLDGYSDEYFQILGVYQDNETASKIFPAHVVEVKEAMALHRFNQRKQW